MANLKSWWFNLADCNPLTTVERSTKRHKLTYVSQIEDADGNLLVFELGRKAAEKFNEQLKTALDER